MTLALRRLEAADVDLFRALRLEMARCEPDAFRFDVDDEQAASREQSAQRLAATFVVGAFEGAQLVGIGGFERCAGAKLRHKGLIWGMYVRPGARGSGAADAIMRALLDLSASIVDQLVLTVVAENARAIRFYERWGFRAYGEEPRAIKRADGSYADEKLMQRAVERA